MSDKDSLVDALCEIDGDVKYHFVDGKSVQFCDEQASPLLEVSMVDLSAGDNKVTWEYNFIKSGDVYRFTHDLDVGDDEQ